MSEKIQGPAQEVMQQFEEFRADAEQFWNRSTVYTTKEYKMQLQRTGMALGVLGAAGFAVKFVCIPLVAMLVG